MTIPSRPTGTVSDDYMRHCMNRAETLREMFKGVITPASVAWLLRHSDPDGRKRVTMTNPDDRCRMIARILRRYGSQDGIWHALEVMEAYRLRNLDDKALAAEDPEPPKPTAPTKLPENLARLNEFSQFLAQQTAQQKPKSAS